MVDDATKGSSPVPIFDRRFQPANSADVMNQTVLSLPCSVWWGMENDTGCIKEMNKIQMQYALDVSKAAVTAYQAVLTALEGTPDRQG